MAGKKLQVVKTTMRETKRASRPPQIAAARANELLAMQPKSLIGLSRVERDRIVVSAVVDDQGREHVVSRLGDEEWRLASEIATQNTAASWTAVRWPVDVPRKLLDGAKDALYIWFRQGRENKSPPVATTLLGICRSCIPTLRHLASVGVEEFGAVRAIHLSDHLSILERTLARSTIRSQLEVIDLVWTFRDEVESTMRADPWSGQSFDDLCSRGAGDRDDAGRIGKTPVIPPSIQAKLFAHAEEQLKNANNLLDLRDPSLTGRQSAGLTAVRDAVLYLLQITSGMRNVEATGVKNNAWRTEVIDGVTFHWVATIDHKTKKGHVEFLVPPEAIEALKLAQRYAAPLQQRLRREIEWLEKVLAEASENDVVDAILMNGMTRVDCIQRLSTARASVDNIFLGASAYGGDNSGGSMQITVMSSKACREAMVRLAKASGVNWKLSNHQCRRTFAWTVANSRLGRTALVFLRWQLKHASVGWTQLYASNPRQDKSLYDEMWEEFVLAQGEVMESWLDPDTTLSGGAGKKIMQTRAIPVENKSALLLHTAQTVTIRSTGHSWCLAEQRGCVGEGIYEASRCTDCSSGVIDQTHAGTWQRIHVENLKLATVTDCGPGVIHRAKREISRSEQTLFELGVNMPMASSTATAVEGRVL